MSTNYLHKNSDYAIPSYPHRLITNLLHSSMDLLSTTCHVLKQTGDTRSACGLHSHPSSMCAALLCGETPEFLEFGARVSPQRLPPTVICTFLALGLPRVFFFFTKRGKGTLQTYSTHLTTYVTYRHPPERRSFQERHVPQPSLARSITTIWGISLAEIELAYPASMLMFPGPTCPKTAG